MLLGAERAADLSPLGSGTDHEAYDVGGAFVLRIPKRGGRAGGLDREADILELVRPVSPIPVPEVIARDRGSGALVLRRLPGTSLLDAPPPDPGALAGRLAGLLASLHGLPRARVEAVAAPDPYPHPAYLADAAAVLPVVAPRLDQQQRRLVETFVSAPPPPEPSATVLCHNDLGAEHLLAGPDRATLTGVIDWADAALADPARDLGRLYRDLGPATAAAILDRLAPPGADALWQRAAFHARCALIEDLAYGLESGDRRYLDAARASLARTFRPV